MDNEELLTPFVASVQNVLSTMTGIEASLIEGEPPERLRSDVAGIIGIAGDRLRGSMAILFTKTCFLAVASEMFGEPVEALDDEVVEIAAEIANMTMGGAKVGLAEHGYSFELSLPSSIWGEQVTVAHKSVDPVKVVSFATPHGPFCLEICVQRAGEIKVEPGSVSSPSASRTA